MPNKHKPFWQYSPLYQKRHKLTICINCKEEKKHEAKGLCRKCYKKLIELPKYREKHKELLSLKAQKRYYKNEIVKNYIQKLIDNL